MNLSLISFSGENAEIKSDHYQEDENKVLIIFKVTEIKRDNKEEVFTISKQDHCHVVKALHFIRITIQSANCNNTGRELQEWVSAGLH